MVLRSEQLTHCRSLLSTAEIRRGVILALGVLY